MLPWGLTVHYATIAEALGDRQVTQSIAITTRSFPSGATDGLVQPKRAAPLWILTVFTQLASASTRARVS